MIHDRVYFRACPERVLIEAARDSGHELALVLGEALEEAVRSRERDSRYIDALEAANARIEAENSQLRDASFD